MGQVGSIAFLDFLGVFKLRLFRLPRTNLYL